MMIIIKPKQQGTTCGMRGGHGTKLTNSYTAFMDEGHCGWFDLACIELHNF